MHNLFSPLLRVKDPRRAHNRLYPMDYILLVVFTASLSGCRSWYEIEDYAIDWEDTLRSLYHKLTGVSLKHCSPCHDTLNRAISLLDIEAFEEAYSTWLQGILKLTTRQHICIDGKTMRGVKKRNFDSSSHTISAYSPQDLASVAQVYIGDKENEIVGIKQLLAKLNLQESMVSIDAIGTQTEIARSIVDKGGDYVLPLKNNQKHSLQEVESYFCPLYQQNIKREERMELGHGRIETRIIESILAPLELEASRILSRWSGLASIHRVTRIREDKKTGKQSREQGYYISSGKDLGQIRKVIREHWAIENKLHYMLDVYMGQDLSEKRQGNAAQIMDMIMKVNLLIMQRLKLAKKSSVPRIEKFLSRISPEKLIQLEI